MNIFIQYLLPSLLPENLLSLFAFLLGSVVTPKIIAKHGKYETLALITVTLINFLGSYLLRRYYTAWFETVTAETIPDTLIGAPQAEVDLEAQPLNFPPMPDTLDIEFNPWTLP
jgi:hypothetical protein